MSSLARSVSIPDSANSPAGDINWAVDNVVKVRLTNPQRALTRTLADACKATVFQALLTAAGGRSSQIAEGLPAAVRGELGARHVHDPLLRRGLEGSHRCPMRNVCPAVGARQGGAGREA